MLGWPGGSAGAAPVKGGWPGGRGGVAEAVGVGLAGAVGTDSEELHPAAMKTLRRRQRKVVSIFIVLPGGWWV